MTPLTQFTHNDYEIVKRDTLYDGFFRLIRYHIRHRLFNGGWSDTFTREMFERHSAAAVLPYDPILDHVILIEQFRPGCISDPKNPWLIEIPAGILSGSDDPQVIAKQEAMEEAGCSILGLEHIMEYYVSPGGSNEYLTLYCGKVDASHASGIHGLKSEYEDIRVINIPAKEAIARLHAGQIKSSPAIISLLWLELNHARLQALWQLDH